MGRPLYRRVRQTIANRGLWGTVRSAVGRVTEALSRGKRAPDRPASEAVERGNLIHPFDLAYGVDTGGLIWGEDLVTSHPNGLWSSAYYGIAPSIFNQVFEKPEFPQGAEWSDYTFLDLGSGKGRAMMLASRLPFGAIAGVEIVPDLVRIARRNLSGFSAPWQRCRTFEVHEGDAASVDLPPTALVIYLYHPFAKPVLEAFLDHLEDSLRRQPRETWLVYFNPELLTAMARHRAFECLFLETFTMQTEDASADRFSNSQESVAVYRYVTPKDYVESDQFTSELNNSL